MPRGEKTTYDLTAGVMADAFEDAIFLDPSPEYLARLDAERAREYDTTVDEVPLGHEVYVIWPRDTEGGADCWATLLYRQQGILFGVPCTWLCTGTDEQREISPTYHRGERIRARRPA